MKNQFIEPPVSGVSASASGRGYAGTISWFSGTLAEDIDNSIGPLFLNGDEFLTRSFMSHPEPNRQRTIISLEKNKYTRTEALERFKVVAPKRGMRLATGVVYYTATKWYCEAINLVTVRVIR